MNEKPKDKPRSRKTSETHLQEIIQHDKSSDLVKEEANHEHHGEKEGANSPTKRADEKHVEIHIEAKEGHAHAQKHHTERAGQTRPALARKYTLCFCSKCFVKILKQDVEDVEALRFAQNKGTSRSQKVKMKPDALNSSIQLRQNESVLRLS